MTEDRPGFTSIFCLLSSLCLLFGVSAASAQVIRGRIIDSTARTGITGALVELRDSAGVITQRTFSGATGGFAFPVRPGHYDVHVAAIGFARHPAEPVTVGSADVELPVFALNPIAISLPAIEAVSGKKSCGKSDLTPDTFAGLLDAAQTSLEVIDGTIRAGTLGFQMRLVHTETIYNNRHDRISADTANRVIGTWPVRALPPDSLAAIGFMRERAQEEGGGQVFYGPDFASLFSDWFLDTHCFTLDRKKSHGDTLVITFQPQGKPKHVDLKGEMVIDRPTLTLRKLSYEHQHLPDGFPDKSAGGTMEFAELMPGLWVPAEWSIWAPIVKVTRYIARPMLGPTITVGRGRGNGGAIQAPPPPAQIAVETVGREENRGTLMRVVPR